MASLIATPPLYVTSFDELSDFTITSSVTGGGAATGTSALAQGKGVFRGRDSLRLYLEAGAADDYVRASFDPNMPVNSERVMFRVFHDIEQRSTAADEEWCFRVFLGNTLGDTTNGVLTDRINDQTKHFVYEALILHQNDFPNTEGTGINWANPIRSCYVELVKSTESGTVEAYFDQMYANWELSAIPIGFSFDDADEPSSATGYGQKEYLWDVVFQPNGWLFTLITTESLTDIANRLSEATLTSLHTAGCDVVWHGEDHNDQRLTSEGGDFATQAAIETSMQNWRDWAEDGSRDYTRPREVNWSAVPFGNYSPTTIDALGNNGWSFHRTSQSGLGQGYLWFDDDAFTAGYNYQIITQNMNQTFTAASLDSDIGDAIDRQMGFPIYGHVFYDTPDPTKGREAYKSEGDAFWTLLEARETAGTVEIRQLTELPDAFTVAGGDGGSLDSVETRRAGPARRRAW